MKFEELQEIVGKEPVFESGLLLAGDVNPNSVRSQLSRFVASGRLLRLRRGLYALAPPFEKSRPHPFLVANRIVHASYVSLQSALSFYGLIPEHVPVVTSVTTLRPWRWENPLGTFGYRHIGTDFFYGSRVVDLGEGQTAMVAIPEKALLDLIHLQPGASSEAYLDELRLENMEILDLNKLDGMADASGRPKLKRAARLIAEIAAVEAEEYELL